MQAGKARFATWSQVNHLRAFDQTACLKIDTFLTVFRGQFNTVTDQRFTGQKFIRRGHMGGTEGLDQFDPRGIAPDQNRAARHQIAFHPLRQNHAVIFLGRLRHHGFKILKAKLRVCQGMGKIKDRAVIRLAVDTRQFHFAFFRQTVKNHRAGLTYGRKLGRIPEQNESWEDFFQILKLAFIQHGAFVNKTDVQRIIAALPAGDKI